MAKKLEVKTGKLDVQYESIFGDEFKIIEAARHQASGWQRSWTSFVSVVYNFQHIPGLWSR